MSHRPPRLRTEPDHARRPQSDLDLGKKIGSGAFGSVFRATLAPEREGEAPVDVIVKKVRCWFWCQVLGLVCAC
jgi:hypothetical protein